MTLRDIWQRVRIFLGLDGASDEQSERNTEYANTYEDISKINFTAIFASKLTSVAMSDSTADVAGDGARVDFLDSCLADMWDKIKRIVARSLGTGGCAIVPYVQDGAMLFGILSQNRIHIHKQRGKNIIHATILSDTLIRNNKKYYRWTDYRVDNGVLHIKNISTNSTGGVVVVDEWQGIADITIPGVNRVLFAFLRCPIDNRGSSDIYGVPITYGSDSIIKDIHECLEQINEEYENKDAKVFADQRLFKKDEKTGKYKMPNDIFFAGNREGSGNLIEIFSPEIRDSSYYNRLVQLFELLEKSIGTSKGILTAQETRGATATEIKAGLYDTYTILTDIRTSVERATKDYLYACDVLANYYGLSSMGNYGVSFDWSVSLIESSAETWGQLKDALSDGIVDKAEVRQWLKPNETMDESQKKVEEIKENSPTLATMLGGE